MIHSRSARGYVLLLALIFAGIFALVSTALVGYVTSYGRAERTTVAAAQALALAEGALNKAVDQLNTDPLYAGETNTALGAGTFTIAVATIDIGTKSITATAYVPNSAAPIAIKAIKANVGDNADVVSFHYAIQTGTGGIAMDQSAAITGNVYSSGSVTGNGSATHCGSITGFGNCIYGDVISGGASGLVYGVTATSSVYAHTIGNAGKATYVQKNAYYATTIVNTTVKGTLAPGSADQPAVPLPISDAKITDWENQAAAGGSLTSAVCDTYSAATNTCTITSARTWGTKKIPFNLILQNNAAKLKVTGPLWIVGNLKLQSGPTVSMDPSLGSTNVAIVVDDPAHRTTSGVINIGQSSQFLGSGAPNSFVFMISWNTTAEAGAPANNVCSNGSIDAICMSQGASSLVAYASHGQVSFSQSASVKATTGYKILLTQSANITFDNGLPSTLFQSGPGGSMTFIPGTYAIAR